MNINYRISLLFTLLLIGLPQVCGQLKWIDPLNQLESVIAGTHWQQEKESPYDRLPLRAKESVRSPLWDLSKESAGLYISFYSNSATIQVKYNVRKGHSMYHMPSTGVSGVDLYAYTPDGVEQWCAASMSFSDTITYNYTDLSYANNHDRGCEYRLFLPLYNSVSSLQIGVNEESSFEFIPLSKQKPIVVYGTSIAQGACASRPGMAWTNILQRQLDAPIINLGFSGNGRLEAELFDLLAEIEAELFIIDCLPNMVGDRTSQISERVLEGVKKIRAKSDAPILFVEHSGYMNGFTSKSRAVGVEDSNKSLQAVFKQLKEELKEQGLYLLTYDEIGLTIESQVDGVHPNDLGMMQYATAYKKSIDKILFNEDCEPLFSSIKQRREPDTYEWRERHEAVLNLNAKQEPEVVLIGNSIVHYWSGEPAIARQAGPQAWSRLFKGRAVSNLGFGWDRIENVKWRLKHGELSGFDAKKIILMIGTNNLSLNSNEEIVTGLGELAELICNYQPNAQLYLVKLLPRRAEEVRIKKLNNLLESVLGDNNQLQLIDVSEELYLQEGLIDESLFLDGLHPNEKGYSKIAKKLKPFVDIR